MTQVKLKSENWSYASTKTQQRPRNKAGRRIRAKRTRNNKKKRPA